MGWNRSLGVWVGREQRREEVGESCRMDEGWKSHHVYNGLADTNPDRRLIPGTEHQSSTIVSSNNTSTYLISQILRRWGWIQITPHFFLFHLHIYLVRSINGTWLLMTKIIKAPPLLVLFLPLAFTCVCLFLFLHRQPPPSPSSSIH